MAASAYAPSELRRDRLSTGIRTFRYHKDAGVPLLFEYEVDPVVVDRVVHGLEVNFVFGNNYGPPLFATYVLNATDLALFRAISGYWTRFARTGNPNTDDPTVVHWPAFNHPTGAGRGSDKHLVFDLTISEGKRQRETYCDFWNQCSSDRFPEPCPHRRREGG